MSRVVVTALRSLVWPALGAGLMLAGLLLFDALYSLWHEVIEANSLWYSIWWDGDPPRLWALHLVVRTTVLAAIFTGLLAVAIKRLWHAWRAEAAS